MSLRDATPTPALLPVGARLAWWGTAWLRGHIGPDDLLDGVTGDDVAHVVVGRPGESLVGLLAGLRAEGAEGCGLALPVEGHLVGLGGPPAFNDAALEVGEAVVVVGTGVGLTPAQVGPVVEWSLHPAARRQVPDLGDADRDLRSTLLGTAETLARLDVARWRPEVADALMNLRHRAPLHPPAGVPPRAVALAERALQALAITELALEDDGGAVSAMEAQRRREALLPLARAGRAGLVAACSPEGWPPA
ncbi:hypothetical protein [Nocardioides sp.]|uniref:hypothetical protein n=1 Tax=Nocardioides sp. TaxID=35761 RepID=UPI0035145849